MSDDEMAPDVAAYVDAYGRYFRQHGAFPGPTMSLRIYLDTVGREDAQALVQKLDDQYAAEWMRL